IAYNLIDEDLRDSVLDILTYHPYYQKHFFDEMPKTVEEDQNLINPWLFSQIAVWSDVIKRKELGYSPQHRRWHYINYPIYLTETDRRYYKNNIPVNVVLKAEGEVSDDWNIAQAFEYNLSLIKSDSLAEKAIALCWLFHLIGDIHQPLHSSALFNERRFIKGDLGGNAISVKGIGVMHVAWDRATYSSRTKDWTFKEYVDFAKNMTKSFQQKGLLSQKDTLFEDWLNESHNLAKEVGYPKELLDAVKESSKEKYGFGNPLSIKLDKEFTRNWEVKIVQISEQQIAKAGYRLAKLLQLNF
ncbi:S1/P1 nuclease, partial [Crocinitomix catalasitica]|nr:S1/P1 nuclease [Crocinitomix catalasitica]